MKKIVMLTCLRAAGSSCTGEACFGALNCRTGAFSRYSGEEIELSAFFHCNGCESEVAQDEGMLEKLARIRKIRPDAVHLGVCTLRRESGRCGTVKKIVKILQNDGIAVIDGTHASPRISDIGRPVTIEGKDEGETGL